MPDPQPDTTATTHDGSPDSWGATYRLSLGTWEDFTARIERLIQDLLVDHQIDVVRLESRTKTVESFVGKLRRKESKYPKPLDQVTDLAGVRVVTYYIGDVDRVVECLLDEFKVIPEHSRGTITESDPDRFGYQSTQYVVRLAPKRAALPEWEQFGDRCVEIQVRTALQHAWAAIDHKLDYKAEREVPRHLKRRLSRLSALLEIADEAFASLRDATEDLDAEYASEVAKGHLELELNTASLDAYLTANDYIEIFTQLALSAGWSDAGERDQSSEEGDKRDLLFAAELTGLSTVKELDAVLREARQTWGETALSAIRAQDSVDAIYAQPYDILTQLVLYGRRAAPEVVEQFGYYREIQEALDGAIASAGPAT
jgi:putative GTP pyrophosphokinase